jgi:phosphonate transport system substrate-binding protein
MAVAQEKKIYSLAVVPQFTPSEVHRTWTPIAEKLSRATGQQFEIKIYPSIPKFEAAFLAGEIDLAFMNPYHAVMAKRAQGYIPLLRDDANPLTGILVVQRDSPIKSIKELSGKALAFPAPNAFGASLYMRALLAEQEKISMTPNYLKTHSNVYRHVIMGEAAAGGGVNNTLKREPPEVQAQLRVLFETPGVPSHPLVAHPRIPEKVRQSVTNTLLEMQNDPAGQKLLGEIQLPKPVKADYARDYQPLEKLKLEKYVVIEKD